MTNPTNPTHPVDPTNPTTAGNNSERHNHRGNAQNLDAAQSANPYATGTNPYAQDTNPYARQKPFKPAPAPNPLGDNLRKIHGEAVKKGAGLIHYGQQTAAGIGEVVSTPEKKDNNERYRAFTPDRVGKQKPDVGCAPITKRIAAQAIDVTLLSVVLLSVAVSMTILTGNWLWLALLLLGPIPFYLWQTGWDSVGGGIGKKIVGLKVTGPANCPVSFEQAARRNLWILSGAIPVIGILVGPAVVIWMASSAKLDAFGMGPHDRFATTRVIDTKTYED